VRAGGLAAGRHRFAGLVSALLLGGGVIGMATGCGSAGARGLNGATREPPQRVAAISLPDVAPGRRGAPLTFRAARSRLMLVYFGYTYCPDVCPTTLADLRNALVQLPKGDRSRVVVAMVTVDPGRDTPAVLNAYLGHFFANWHALRTSSPDALRTAERAFGASHRIGRRNASGAYEVSHTAEVYAVDSTGTVRVEWPFGMRSAEIAGDLRRLLDRREPA